MEYDLAMKRQDVKSGLDRTIGAIELGFEDFSVFKKS